MFIKIIVKYQYKTIERGINMCDNHTNIFSFSLNYGDWLPKPQEPIKLYHYTSIAGFNSILFNNRDKVTLWATRYDCVNDKSEEVLINDIFNEVCNDLKDKKAISQEEFDLIKDCKPSKEVLFIGPHKKEGYNCSYYSEFDRYICCFSTEADSLPMWNYYSKNKKYMGYNIEFDLTELDDDINQQNGKNINIGYYAVIYKKGQQKKILKEFLLKLLKSKPNQKMCQDTISEILSDCSILFKHKCFKYEKEARMIIDVPKNISEDALQENKINVKYRFHDGLMIPYIELELAKKCVSGVNAGPLLWEENEKEHQKLILMKALKDNGYRENVNCSQLPVRY